MDELKAGYSRNRASTKRFQEAAAMRGEVQRFVAELKKGDPNMVAALFGKIGLDFDAIAEAHLTRKLEELQMPEPDRKMRELQRERAAFEAEKRRLAEQSQQAQIQRAAVQERARIEAEMGDAFQAHGLEMTPMMVSLVASELEKSLRAGYPMPTSDAVQLVVEDLRGQVKSLPRDQLARLLGAEQADQMRRQAGQAAAQQQRKKAAQNVQAAATRRKPSEAKLRPVNTDDFEAVRRLFDA
jgi:hypothetical protein